MAKVVGALAASSSEALRTMQALAHVMRVSAVPQALSMQYEL